MSKYRFANNMNSNNYLPSDLSMMEQYKPAGHLPLQVFQMVFGKVQNDNLQETYSGRFLLRFHCSIIEGPHGIMIKIDIFRWWLTLQVQTRSWCWSSNITVWICRIAWWWLQQTFDWKHSIRITISSRGRTRMGRGVWFHDYFQQVLTCCRLTRKHLTVVKRPQCNQPCAVKFFEARENLVKTLRFKTDLLPFNEKYLTVRLPQQSAPVECSEKAGENLVKTSQYRIRLPPALVSHAYPSLGLVTTRKQRAVQQRRHAAGKAAPGGLRRGAQWRRPAASTQMLWLSPD